MSTLGIPELIKSVSTRVLNVITLSKWEVEMVTDWHHSWQEGAICRSGLLKKLRRMDIASSSVFTAKRSFLLTGIKLSYGFYSIANVVSENSGERSAPYTSNANAWFNSVPSLIIWVEFLL